MQGVSAKRTMKGKNCSVCHKAKKSEFLYKYNGEYFCMYCLFDLLMEETKMDISNGGCAGDPED